MKITNFQAEIHSINTVENKIEASLHRSTHTVWGKLFIKLLFFFCNSKWRLGLQLQSWLCNSHICLRHKGTDTNAKMMRKKKKKIATDQTGQNKPFCKYLHWTISRYVFTQSHHNICRFCHYLPLNLIGDKSVNSHLFPYLYWHYPLSFAWSYDLLFTYMIFKW